MLLKVINTQLWMERLAALGARESIYAGILTFLTAALVGAPYSSKRRYAVMGAQRGCLRAVLRGTEHLTITPMRRRDIPLCAKQYV